MAVFYIGSYDVTDPELYDQYVQKVIPLLSKHGCEIVVADREAMNIEGASRSIHLVLKFATKDSVGAYAPKDSLITSKTLDAFQDELKK